MIGRLAGKRGASLRRSLSAAVSLAVLLHLAWMALPQHIAAMTTIGEGERHAMAYPSEPPQPAHHSHGHHQARPLNQSAPEAPEQGHLERCHLQADLPTGTLGAFHFEVASVAVFPAGASTRAEIRKCVYPPPDPPTIGDRLAILRVLRL